MQQWQHAWISINPNEREDLYKLEQMGNEGWEMVSVISWNSNIRGNLDRSLPASPRNDIALSWVGDVLMVFFKRPKPEE